MGTKLLSIGEFSIATRLSPKALRLYDRLGLLRPERVDAATSYRWYDPAQITRAPAVGLLRRLEMPLSLISQVLDEPPQQAMASVRSHAASDSRAASRLHRTCARCLGGVGSGTQVQWCVGSDLRLHRAVSDDRAPLAAQHEGLTVE